MDRRTLLFPIGLIFGLGIGFVIAAANGITLDGHDHSDPAHHGASQKDGHAHGDMLDLAAQANPPSVSARVLADPVSGWNLNIEVQNFTFAAERAGGPHVDGEGHAHVYVNGIKIARAYGPWMHIGDLPSGQTDVRVTLNSNDHRDLALGARPIATTVTVDVPAN